MCSAVFKIFVFAVITLQVGTEELFFHRDHHDQDIYKDNNSKTFEGVRTHSQLVDYLNKYGYLNCEYRPQEISLKRRRDTLNTMEESDNEKKVTRIHLEICLDETVNAALLTLQSTLGIQKTGRLDKETVRLLNSDRCGNSDKSIDYAANTLDYVTYHVGDETMTTEYMETSVDMNEDEMDTTEAPVVRSKRSLPEHFRNIQEHDKIFHHFARKRRSSLLRQIRDGIESDPKILKRLHKRVRRKFSKRSLPLLDNTIVLGTDGTPIAKFKQYTDRPITWRLLTAGYSKRFPILDQISMLELAFRMWSEVSPLRFKRQDEGHIDDVDVHIVFGKGKHLDCPKAFDGNGGEYAHSRVGFDMHFDDDENFKIRDYGRQGIYFVRVAVHEIGHVLGLGHNDKRDSIMFPVYQNSPGGMDLELGSYDRRALQRIYGVCRGTFDLVFDWLRKKSTPGKDIPKYIFNTYFFRGDHYWMYENRANRTRFGDPLFIANEWKGLPNKIDCYTQVLLRVGSYEYDINTYFFKGEHYFMYDDDKDEVKPGYPKLIRQDFGSQTNCNGTIPDNLDAVYYDRRHDLMYFFKNKWVWSFDPKNIGSGCFERKYLFTDLFPMETGETEVVSGDVSQLFYSYAHRTLYVFVGETVYENVAYASGDNLLKKHSQWYHKWYDICDVTADGS